MIHEPKISGFGVSHTGRVRTRNEDFFHIDDAGRFAILADGMGGHRGGYEASRLAVDSTRQTLVAQHAALLKFSQEEVRSFLIEEFSRCSLQVYRAGCADAALQGMGCTLVIWLLLGERVFIAHVGDSRAYLCRKQKIFQLTADHTLENEQIRSGVARANLYTSVQMKHAIFRSIGLAQPTEPSVMCQEIQVGDRWILCSDGLSNKLDSHEILAALLKETHSIPRLCRLLVGQAWACGGEDNITVVALSCMRKGDR